MTFLMVPGALLVFGGASLAVSEFSAGMCFIGAGVVIFLSGMVLGD